MIRGLCGGLIVFMAVDRRLVVAASNSLFFGESQQQIGRSALLNTVAALSSHLFTVEEALGHGGPCFRRGGFDPIWRLVAAAPSPRDPQISSESLGQIRTITVPFGFCFMVLLPLKEKKGRGTCKFS